MAFKDYFKEHQSIQINKVGNTGLDIFLRRVNPEKDVENYLEIYSDAEVFEYLSGNSPTPKLESVQKIIANEIKFFDNGSMYAWVITDAKSDKLIGKIFLTHFEYNNKVSSIGYFLNRRYWGGGIITECIKAVTKFGFEYLELERIYTTVSIDNPGSFKALEKSGFTREGMLRHCFDLKNKLGDCYMYSKLDTDK